MLSSSKDSRTEKESSGKSDLFLPHADKALCETPTCKVQAKCSLGTVQVISWAGHVTRKRGTELVRIPIFNKSIVTGEITQLHLGMRNSWPSHLVHPHAHTSEGHNYPPIAVAERCRWNRLWCFNSLARIHASPLPWTCTFHSCNWKLNESSKWHSQSLHHQSLAGEGWSFGGMRKQVHL